MIRRSSHAWLRPRRLQISQLEDRLLFDAVPDAAALAAASEATPAPQSSESQSAQTTTQQQVSHELIIIDPRVADSDQLLSDLIAEQPNRSFEVRYLNQSEDGVEQITRLLESSTATYDAVHIFSHGQPGQIELGSIRLSSANLTEYAAEFTRWGHSLTADADLLFYGCDVASSADGVQMLEEISLLSGADVAASTDATGHASRGGDWDLELQTGAIETGVAVTEQSQQNWRHLLDPPTATMVGLEAFLQGTLVEVGVRASGTFGAEGAPPPGFHGPRSETGLFGFISNPQNNNWAEFDGDFFTPGSPEEGFTLQFDGVNYSNNTSYTEEIPGHITGVSTGTFGGVASASVDWTGTVDGMRIDRHITITENGLFILMQTTITNTLSRTVNDIYWMHNVDPDNDQPLHGDYTTTNTIINQPSGPTDKLALVIATQSQNDGSSVSLVAKDERARVTSGGFSNRNASDVWNGFNSDYGQFYLYNEGDSVYEDEAISLAFQLGSLAPGESITFAYAYNLELDPTEVFEGLDQIAAPPPPDLVDSSDSGISQTDNLTNDTTPTFSGPAGSGEPGSTVTLYIDGNPIATAIVNPDGSYSITVPNGSDLPEGNHQATTSFTDTEGNEGDLSAPLDFVVDTTPPTPPTITSSFPTELTGTGEPGTFITVLGPNGDPLLGPDDQPLQTVVNPDGTWTFSGFHPQLTNQDVVTVISTDAAGNSSQTESTLTIFAYDSFQNMSIPPSLTTPLFRPHSEILLSRLMFDLGSNPTITGMARPGTHLVVRMYGVDGSVQAESYIIADASGNWIAQLPASLPNDAPRIVIEHISTNEIPIGSSGFSLSGPTYSQLLYGVSSAEQDTILGVLSSTASSTLEADHEENLNPLNWL